MTSLFSYYQRKYLPDKQSQGYAGMVATIVWVGALALLLLMPAVQNSMSTRTAISQADQTEKALARNVEIIEQAKRNLDAEQQTLTLVEDAFPKTPQVVSFVNNVDKALETFNLRKEAFDYDGRASLGVAEDGTALNAASDARVRFSSLDFNITAEGSYTDINNFVTRLETLPRFVEIDTLQIEQVEDEQAQSIAQKVIISGKFYYEDE